MNYKTPFLALLALFSLLACAYFTLQGTGLYASPSYLNIALLAVLIAILNRFTKLFYALLLPFILIHALYAPIGITFGEPSYQYVASVFATDLLETKEFLSQLRLENYLMPLKILGSLFVYRWATAKMPWKFAGNEFFVAIAVATMIFTQAPFGFVMMGFASIIQAKDELQRLNAFAIQSKWGKSTLSDRSRYDDYVLIIGESARRDYHHAYGYPVENTPFMSNANGTLINGFTSGGTNTIASLKLMLTKPDKAKWQEHYDLNLIDMIKSADIETFWFSNHGYLGRYDTPISAIANRSDHTAFLKQEVPANTNVSDFALLPKLDKVLQQPSKGKRFIVLHLYGSHPITCDRLEDYPKIFDDSKLAKKYFNVNCYVSSIKKTDELLSRVHQALSKNYAENHRSFSMVYFSDHGLAHDITENNIVIHNSNGASKLHYNVPLFKISSDDTARYEYSVFKSGLNFTEGIADWIGIQNPELGTKFDLFSNQADTDDYGLQQRIDRIQREPDHAVVIP